MSWLVTFFDGFDMNVISFTSKNLQGVRSTSTRPTLRLSVQHRASSAPSWAVSCSDTWGSAWPPAGHHHRRPACFSSLTLLLAFAGTIRILIWSSAASWAASRSAAPYRWSGR